MFLSESDRDYVSFKIQNRVFALWFLLFPHVKQDINIQIFIFL